MKIKCCFLLILSALVIHLCGCAREQTTSEIQQDSLTVWMALVEQVTAENFGETEIAKAVQERTGISVEFIHPPRGQETEKFNLMVSSADLPDVIEFNWLNYPGGPSKAIKEGVIIDLSAHLDKAPNLAAYLSENKEIKKLATTDSGELFSFPFVRSDKSLGFSNGLVVRMDWLEELGLEMPGTIDEWEAVLTAFRDRKGAKVPYSAHNLDHFAFGFDTTDGFYLESGRVKFGILDEGYREFTATMNRWYNMGLVDPSFATLDIKTVRSNLMNGKSGASVASIGAGIGQMLAEVSPESDFNIEGAPIPVKNKGDRSRFGIYQLPVTSSVTAFNAVTTSCSDITSAMKFLDYGYSPEGHMLYNFGIEGVSYEMIDGYPTYTKLITHNPDGQNMSNALGMYTRSCYTGPFVQDVRYMEQYAAMPQQKRAWEIWSDTDAAETTLPHLYMQENELTEYAHLNNEITAYADDMTIKLIIGAEPMENYDIMIDTLYEKGIERLIELMQSAYERYLSK